jgi:hypothetical protein
MTQELFRQSGMIFTPGAEPDFFLMALLTSGPTRDMAMMITVDNRGLLE